MHVETPRGFPQVDWRGVASKVATRLRLAWEHSPRRRCGV